MSAPYAFIRCPCAETSDFVDGAPPGAAQHLDEPAQEMSFDPRSPRSCFSLYPREHLMWCEDCHDIRCPRCTIEEIVLWYCPSCMFEVSNSMVKSEGNR